MSENTNFKSLSLQTRESFFLQNGTIPSGVTALGSKYPINSSDVSIDNPNYLFGPTQTPLLPFNTVDQNFKLIINGDWTGKVKPKDAVKMKRGSIENDYEILQAIYYPGASATNISLTNKRGVVNLLDPFIGASGYPYPSPETYLELGRKIESPNIFINYVKDFTLKMVPESSDSFLAVINWEIDPLISATRLRWRSMPRNFNLSNLSFSVSVAGDYSRVPEAQVISSTGRLAQIQLTGTLKNLAISATGASYTAAYAYATGGGGTGASFSVSLSGGGISTVTLASGGTGYSSLPEIVIVGDGTGASVSVSELTVTGVQIVQQGGNYLSPPTVVVNPTYLSGLTAAEISSSLVLLNEGRIDYIRVVSGGTGYTGASVVVNGSLDAATAVAEITDGAVSNIVLTYTGYGYTASSVTITPTGTGGSGAAAVANIDIFSQWVYEDPLYTEKTRTIKGLKYNVPYQIEILAAEDSRFRGITKYTNSLHFQYYK
jgi:hypothetical protein